MKKVLTTGQVAKLCGVATQTVCKWISLGLLKGYLLPGSTHRRIPAEEVERFMRENGIPRT